MIDEESDQIFQADMKRQHDTYGPTAETPRTPYGSLKVGALTPAARPVTERIADVCKRVNDASQTLAAARRQCDQALLQRSKCEVMFDQVAAELLQAIKEHRGESESENGTYPR